MGGDRTQWPRCCIGGEGRHIPRGALPSVPRLLWILLAIAGFRCDIGRRQSGDPGGHGLARSRRLLNFLRFAALSIVLLGMGAIGVVDHQCRRKSRPRWPHWVADCDHYGSQSRTGRSALALALRTFPMLIDEFRVLYAARRLRPKQTPRTRRARLRQLATDAIDLIVAVITVTLRRADEMGDAITARGGTGSDLGGPVAAEKG